MSSDRFTPEQRASTLMVDHAKHGPWTQEGRCVYCVCGARLYRGHLPRSNRQAFAAALDATLENLRRRGVKEPPGP